MCVYIHMCVCVRSGVSNSLQPHRPQSTGLCLRDFPGKNIGGACHFLLQRISPTQSSNLGLLHCRLFLYQLSQQGRPHICVYKTHTGCEYMHLLFIICLYVEMVFVKAQDHCWFYLSLCPSACACGCSV